MKGGNAMCGEDETPVERGNKQALNSFVKPNL